MILGHIALFLFLLWSNVSAQELDRNLNIQIKSFDELPLSGSSFDSIEYGYQWYSILNGLDYTGFSLKNEKSPLLKLEDILDFKPRSILKKRNIFALWTGYCAGVANLSLVASLPKTDVDVAINNGNIVRLSPSDIHAIASLAMSQATKNSRLLGKRCNRSRIRGNKRENGCDGVPADQFHLALANSIGLDGESFIIDSERYHKVNNIPIISYKTSVLDSYENSNNTKTIKLRTLIEVPTKVHFKAENILSSTSEKIEYLYSLDIDLVTNIILSGSWISTKRPDFLWKKDCRKFEGIFEFLNDLLIWKC